MSGAVLRTLVSQKQYVKGLAAWFAPLGKGDVEDEANHCSRSSMASVESAEALAV